MWPLVAVLLGVIFSLSSSSSAWAKRQEGKVKEPNLSDSLAVHVRVADKDEVSAY